MEPFVGLIGGILLLLICVHAVFKIIGIKVNVFQPIGKIAEMLVKAILDGIGWLLKQLLIALGRGVAALFRKLFGLPPRGREICQECGREIRRSRYRRVCDGCRQ